MFFPGLCVNVETTLGEAALMSRAYIPGVLLARVSVT